MGKPSWIAGFTYIMGITQSFTIAAFITGLVRPFIFPTAALAQKTLTPFHATPTSYYYLVYHAVPRF